MVFDAFLPVARHGVDGVAVVFIAVGSQRGEQALSHQVRGIDIDVEIIRNARYFTSLAQRAGISLDFLVVYVGSGVVQVAVCLYDKTVGVFRSSELSRNETESPVFLDDIQLGFDV